MTMFWDSVQRLLYMVLPPELSVDSLFIFAALLFGIIIFLIGKFLK